jgi:hypothetical protein
MVDALNFFLTILAGVAVIVGVLVLVYLFTLALDNYCCCCETSGSQYLLTPQEVMERQHASDLTKMAGLAGVLSAERIKVYRHFFEQQAVIYICGDDERTRDKIIVKESGDVESQDAMSTNITINNSTKTSVKQQDKTSMTSPQQLVVESECTDLNDNQNELMIVPTAAST